MRRHLPRRLTMDACLDQSTGLFSGGPRDWGTQRARVRVAAEADVVIAELPWRRHEEPPPQAAVVVTGPGGGRVERAGAAADL